MSSSGRNIVRQSKKVGVGLRALRLIESVIEVGGHHGI